MCTAVDGGSIHRAARRISAASDQRSTTPMASHRTKDRRKPLRSVVFASVSGFSITFQNNRLGWVAAYGFCEAILGRARQGEDLLQSRNPLPCLLLGLFDLLGGQLFGDEPAGFGGPPRGYEMPHVGAHQIRGLSATRPVSLAEG